MMTRVPPKFFILPVTAFIIGNVLPSETSAMRGLSSLIGALVEARSGAGLARRFMAAAAKRDERASLPKRTKSPVRREQKKVIPEEIFQASESLEILTPRKRGALLRLARTNCQPTLEGLDTTIASLRASPYSLGEAAKTIIDLVARAQSLRDSPDKLASLARDPSVLDWLFDATGWWRGGICAAFKDLKAFPPSSRERRSLQRIDQLFADIHRTLGLPYERPQKFSGDKS